MKKSVAEVVISYIREEYLDEEDGVNLEEGTALISSGIVDSFSMVSLKRFLETRYKVRIPDGRATPEAFDSVERIVALLGEFGVE